MIPGFRRRSKQIIQRIGLFPISQLGCFLELHSARGYQRKFSGLAVVELPAPRAWKGRRRKVRAPQRAILWVPSLRSTRTPKQPPGTLSNLFGWHAGPSAAEPLRSVFSAE